MEDNFFEYFGIVALVLALSLYLPFNKVITNMTISVKKGLKDRKEIYQQAAPLTDGNQYMSYADLIGTLISDELEYDMVIENELYYKNNHHSSKVDFDKISKSTYIKTYQYNDEGKIIKVILKKYK